MINKDEIDNIARRIAWAHWKAIHPQDTCRDSLHLWECLGNRDRDAYRAAALEVALM